MSRKHHEFVSLVGGPYLSPAVQRGDDIFCEIRGLMEVAYLSDAPIQWPRGRVPHVSARPFIVCGGLVQALFIESSQAIQYHWGICPELVTRWRKKLNAPRYTTGTLSACRNRLAGTYVVIDAEAIISRREAGGLTCKELARKTGVSGQTIREYEMGRISRIHPERLRLLADALGCSSNVIMIHESVS